jgi:hypothetical protein
MGWIEGLYLRLPRLGVRRRRTQEEEEEDPQKVTDPLATFGRRLELHYQEWASKTKVNNI